MKNRLIIAMLAIGLISANADAMFRDNGRGLLGNTVGSAADLADDATAPLQPGFRNGRGIAGNTVGAAADAGDRITAPLQPGYYDRNDGSDSYPNNEYQNNRYQNNRYRNGY